MESWLIAVNCVGTYAGDWSHIQGSIRNHENQGKTILGGCCSWCMLYMDYAVLGVCCTRHIVYSAYTILVVCCTR
jgi:hypothetical protein